MWWSELPLDFRTADALAVFKDLPLSGMPELALSVLIFFIFYFLKTLTVCFITALPPNGRLDLRVPSEAVSGCIS